MVLPDSEFADFYSTAMNFNNDSHISENPACRLQEKEQLKPFLLRVKLL